MKEWKNPKQPFELGLAIAILMCVVYLFIEYYLPLIINAIL